MLTLVKQKIMLPEVEKTWNARVNVWIRSPGLMFCSIIILMLSKYAPDHTICRDPNLFGNCIILFFQSHQTTDNQLIIFEFYY